MSNDGNDTLMRMVIKSGIPVMAECQTEVTRDGDVYVDDYYNGQFFEIDEFRFNLKVVDSADKGTDKSGNTEKGNNASTRAALNQGSAIGGSRARTAPVGTGAGAAATTESNSEIVYAKWKSATPTQIQEIMATTPYPIEMGEVSIERTFDKASPILFDFCCNSKTFESVSMIKRKDIGDVFLRGYLRLDFYNVLITGIDWKNGDVMKETFTFVFRQLQINYRAVAFEPGQLIATLKPQPEIIWDYAADLKATDTSS
jgi:type VI protein secretion system component Hcp